MAPMVKKDAHDIILDFIRSRPPLKPVSVVVDVVEVILALMLLYIQDIYDVNF